MEYGVLERAFALIEDVVRDDLADHSYRVTLLLRTLPRLSGRFILRTQ
jgi:hypothetical protein